MGISSPYKRFGAEYLMDSHSPYRPEYMLKPSGFSPSPAFNFNDSSYRRNGGQNYFFNPYGFQDSVGKTPNDMFKAFNFDSKMCNNQMKSAFTIPKQGMPSKK